MEQPTTLRESLEAAIGHDPEPVETVEEPQPVAEVEQPAEPAPNLNELAETEQPVEEKPQETKFKKAPPPEITPGPKAGPKTEKAPVAWKPEVREHWAKLPDSVKAEVVRRETEIQRNLKDSAEARQYAEAISKTFQPYEAYIKAEGATPLQVIDNLMGTAVRLRTATGPELANLMAGMVQQFGTGRFGGQFIDMLDSALAGVAPQDSQQNQLNQAIQQQLAPVQQFMHQFQQAQQAQQYEVASRAQNEVEQFISQTEFGEDVREDMADLMELASRRGQELTLADAYKQACMINPTVRSALMQRTKTKQAQSQSAVAQRARAAAVSVPSSGPALAIRQEPTDIRSAIEAAISMNAR